MSRLRRAHGSGYPSILLGHDDALWAWYTHIPPRAQRAA